VKRVIKVARFEVFTVVKIQVEVFWIVTPCSALVDTLERRQCGSVERWYPTTILHCVTTQKTSA